MKEKSHYFLVIFNLNSEKNLTVINCNVINKNFTLIYLGIFNFDKAKCQLLCITIIC